MSVALAPVLQARPPAGLAADAACLANVGADGRTVATTTAVRAYREFVRTQRSGGRSLSHSLPHSHSPSHAQVCILSDVPVSPRLPFFYCELQLQSMGQDGNFNVSVGLVPTSLKGANRGQQLMPGQIPRCAGVNESAREREGAAALLSASPVRPSLRSAHHPPPRHLSGRTV